MVKKLLSLAMGGFLLLGATEVMAKGPGSATGGKGQMYRYQGGKQDNAQVIQQQDQLRQQKRDQQRQRIRDPQTHQQTIQ